MKTCYWSSICGVYKRHKNYKNFKCRECTRNNRAKNVIRCQEHFEKLGMKTDKKLRGNRSK